MAKKRQESSVANASSEQRLRGVRMRKWGKWVAEVRIPNSRGRIWLGSYHTPQQAARAYDCALYCLRGSRARLNFPDCTLHIPAAASLSPAQIRNVAARFALQDFSKPSDNCVAFTGSECESFAKRQSNWEGNKTENLEVVDLKDNESPNFDGFPLELDDLEFLLLEVEKLEGGIGAQHFLP